MSHNTPKLVSIAEDAVKALISMAFDEDKGHPWTSVSHSHGVHVKSRKTETPMLQWVGEGELDYVAEDAYQLLCDAVGRVEWDHVMDEYSILEHIEGDIDVSYTRTKPSVGGLIAGRDFVDLRVCRKTVGPDGTEIFIMAWAYLDPEVAPEIVAKRPQDAQGKVVRGLNYPGGFVIRRVSDNPKHCKMQYAVMTDIKGSVPIWLVNKGTGGALDTIFSGLKAALKKHYGTK